MAFVAVAPAAEAQPLGSHQVVLDQGGLLIPWVTPQRRAYHEVVELSWRRLLGIPVQPATGLPTYLTNPVFDAATGGPGGHPFHNPAGLYGMLADGASRYYAYSGDKAVVDLVSRALDHQLSAGTTPGDWVWANVPFASADAGAVLYRGGDDVSFCGGCGAGDGRNVIEPDKVGELGVGYVITYKLTGDARYLAAAISSADALVAHRRPGDDTHSPWPFRVHADTGSIREEYTANVVGAVRLFDELVRMGQGDVAGYAAARDAAWSWLMTYPMRNDLWSAYFEDMPIQPILSENLNQYIPMETARFILRRPEYDQDWSADVPRLIAWVERTFGQDFGGIWHAVGRQWGATVISEQSGDLYKMGSHTARYASVNALWYERTGDLEARERAYRSFNWATYMCDGDGNVRVGDFDTSYWFTDGYGDYSRHFLAGMAAVPEWAPAGEPHLLGSSSVVQNVSYDAAAIRYATFDTDAVETFRLPGVPAWVTAGGVRIARRSDLLAEGFVVREIAGGDAAVWVRHGSRNVVIGPTYRPGCGCGGTVDGGSWLAAGIAALLWRRYRLSAGEAQQHRRGARGQGGLDGRDTEAGFSALM